LHPDIITAQQSNTERRKESWQPATSGGGTLELWMKAASSNPDTLELKLDEEMVSSPAAFSERMCDRSEALS